MKRCPECRRDYYDDSLSFCLEDGAPLVQGTVPVDEPATAVLGSFDVPVDNDTTRVFAKSTVNQNRQSEIPALRSDAFPENETSKTFDKRLLLAPIVIALVVLAGYRYFGANTRQIESIAVMPFVNGSGSSDLEYLSDGMAETLIASLSRLPNLSVKARSAVFRYKGTDTSPRQIASDLNVQAVLNGRVIQRSDQLTVTLELIDAGTENVIWAETYNRPQKDLVVLQTEIARDVSTKLKSKLSGADEQNLTKEFTANSEAYRLYLQGRFNWNKRDEASFRRAVDYFNQAITLDHDYALAYAGLADTYALMSTFGFVPQPEGMPKAQEYARRAMSLDETLAEPHTALAVTLQSYEYDFAAAEREYRRAIELNPNYLTGHQWYGEMLVCAGRFEEAAAQYRMAIAIDPLSVPANWEYARSSYYARNFDESIARHEQVLKMDPGFQGAYRTLAEAYRIKGDFAKASQTMARFYELGGETQKAAMIRDAFAKDGWNGVLRLMIAGNALGLRHAILARAYLELGERDNAFAELNTAYQKREAPLQWLKVEPQFDPIREDPRFRELVSRMKLSQ